MLKLRFPLPALKASLSRTACALRKTTPALLLLASASGTQANVSLEENIAYGTAWPWHTAVTIQSGAPINSNAVTVNGTTAISQTFTPSRNMDLRAIYLTYSTSAASTDNAFNVRIQQVSGGSGATSYAVGTDLLGGGSPVRFPLASTGGAVKILKFDVDGTHQIRLNAGATYAVEITSTGSTALFYRRTSNTYTGGKYYSAPGATATRTAAGDTDLAMALLAAAVTTYPPAVVMTASASTQHSASYDAAHAIDLSYDTFWHTPFDVAGGPSPVSMPQHLTVDYGSARQFTGISYLPRQDGNVNGNIEGYRVLVSSNGTTFNQVASGTWARDAAKKIVTFPATTGRYLRLEATAVTGNWANIAELTAFPVQAEKVNDFLNSIGVGTSIHLRQENVTNTIQCIRELGVRWVRSGPDIVDPVRGMNAHLQLHNETGVVYSFGGLRTDVNFPVLFSNARQLAQEGALLAFEGPNEPHTWDVTFEGEVGGRALSWTPVAKFQREMYTAVKCDPMLADYPVWTLSDTRSEMNNVGLQFLTIPTGVATEMPVGTKYADFGNIHNYMYVAGSATYGRAHDNTGWAAADPTYKNPLNGIYKNFGKTDAGYLGYNPGQLLALPRVTTETASRVDLGLGIPPEKHGIDLLTCYLSQYKRGFKHTSIYFLRDRTDEASGEIGFYSGAYQPRPAATYLHNLTTILADTGSIAQGWVNYSIPTQPRTVHDLLLQKSNGKFYLVVWNEKASVTATDAVTVNLGATYPSVNLFKPTVGTSPVQTLTNASSVNLTLDNQPVILEFAPGAASTTVVSTSFVSTSANQNLNGTTIGLGTNLPNGSWIWGAGVATAPPRVPASSASPNNAADLAGDRTALGVSISSAGSYTKPTRIRISAEILVTGTNGGGLGFWSTMPARTDGVSWVTGFTGLNLKGNGNLFLYVNGAGVGSSVPTMTLAPNTFYPFSYDIDTTTGALSNVVFNGQVISGLATNGFTNARTAFAGAFSGTGGRTWIRNFKITSW